MTTHLSTRAYLASLYSAQHGRNSSQRVSTKQPQNLFRIVDGFHDAESTTLSEFTT